jgi:hypothetical protein
MYDCSEIRRAAARAKSGVVAWRDSFYKNKVAGMACRRSRTYLKTSKLPEEDADGRELDEAEEVPGVVLPANQ